MLLFILSPLYAPFITYKITQNKAFPLLKNKGLQLFEYKKQLNILILWVYPNVW